MSDQIREKEKSLAELMVRILKEPLKPLGESVKGLEGELSDIKGDIEVVSGVVGECLTHLDSVAKRSKDSVGLLGTLRDEQAEWARTLQSSITDHVEVGTRTISARLVESLSAAEQGERRVLDVLAGMGEVQLSAARALEAFPAQLGENTSVLSGALVQLQMEVAAVNAAVSSGLKAAADGIAQSLELQNKTAQAVNQALVAKVVGAVEQAQAVTAESLQSGQALRDLLISGQVEIIDALNQHVEVMNVRFDQSQAKLRRLTLATSVLFVSTLAYLGCELLDRLI